MNEGLTRQCAVSNASNGPRIRSSIRLVSMKSWCFEDRRARLNSYVCTALQRAELQDSARFESRYKECERNTLDEVQVYRDVRVVEDRRRIEGK
jgi:hypothetical protein